MSNVQQNDGLLPHRRRRRVVALHLKVLPAPMVTAVKLDYDFPDYTQVPPRKDIEGGNVEAIEDTKVTVHATTNEPARAGRST